MRFRMFYFLLLGSTVIMALEEGAPPLPQAPDGNAAPPTPEHHEPEALGPDVDDDPLGNVKNNPVFFLNDVARRVDSLKVMLEIGARDCYYEEIPAKHTIAFEAAVYFDDAGPNAEQITYSVHYINNDTMVAQETADSQKSYQFVHKSEEGGTYSICFENSHISAKVIWLMVGRAKTFSEIPESEESYLKNSNVAVAKFMETMNKLEEWINESAAYLRHFRLEMVKDHRVQHVSQYFMTLWSVLQFLIIIGTGFAQVYCLKKFFEKDEGKSVRPKPCPSPYAAYSPANADTRPGFPYAM